VLSRFVAYELMDREVENVVMCDWQRCVKYVREFVDMSDDKNKDGSGGEVHDEVQGFVFSRLR